MDVDMDVLSVVPSTQPDPSQTPLQRSARRYSGQRPERPHLLAPPPASVPPPIPWTQEPTVGRGILHLRAPPKLARAPASRRQPPPCTVVPLPQWTIEVPAPTPVEFRAETPILSGTAQEPTNRLPLTSDIFQDADVDYWPLTGSWADIVAQVEQAATASASVTSADTIATSTSAEIPPTASSSIDRNTRVVDSMPTVVSSSSASIFAGTTAPVPIPVMVAAVAVDSPVTPAVIAATTGASLEGRPPTGMVSQSSNRPILRLADIMYAVGMSRVRQSDHIVDTLVNCFRTDRPRDQLLLAVQAMFALLNQIGYDECTQTLRKQQILYRKQVLKVI